MKTILVTVSDDRSGRKNGLYSTTQNKIKWMFNNDINVNFGIEHYAWDINGILHSEFYEPNKVLLDNVDPARNGRIYKPLAIQYELSKLNYGDYLIYNDCSPEIWEMNNYVLDDKFDIEVIHNLTNKAGGILVAFVKWDNKHLKKGELGRHTHKHFTMDCTLQEMDAMNYKNSFLCASGMICIKKTLETQLILDEWVRYSQNPKCSCLGDPTIPNDTSYWAAESTAEFDTEGFKLGHRHDQSILSVLLNKRNTYYVDIQHTDVNPYNFINFCRKDLDYEFINSNSVELVNECHIKKGDKVINNKKIELNVYDVEFRNNIWILKVGIHEQSCYETRLKYVEKI